jgi:hypothetical protein
MAISFQSLEFNGSTTTIQQRAFSRHPPFHGYGKLPRQRAKKGVRGNEPVGAGLLAMVVNDSANGRLKREAPSPASRLLQELRRGIRESLSLEHLKINLQLANHHTACGKHREWGSRPTTPTLKAKTRPISHKLNSLALQIIDVQLSCNRKEVLA